MKDGSKYRFEHIPYPFGTETIDGAKVWTLSSSQPHERNVFSDGFCNLTGGIDSLSVGVNDDIVQPIYGSIDKTNEVILWNVFF